MKKLFAKHQSSSTTPPVISNAIPAEDADKKRAEGAHTYFYINYLQLLNLSQQADRKAHILIGINVFLLSFVVTRKKMGILAHHQHFLIPNGILILTSIATLILATQAARPRLWKNPKDPANESEVNWLFFGEFYQYSFETFHRHIWQLMQKKARLYDAMSCDVLRLSKTLASQYFWLSWCYRVFIIGVLLTFAAYAVVLLRMGMG